jgi:hypothetical protein
MHVHIRSLFAVPAVLVSLALVGCVGSVDEGSTQESDSEHSTQSQTAVTSCKGTGCDGKSPDATGCGADGTTVASCNVVSNGQIVGNVAMRYSKTCGAIWTHTTSNVAEYLHADVLTPSGGASSASPGATTGYKSAMEAVFPLQTGRSSGYVGAYYGDLRSGCSVTHSF